MTDTRPPADLPDPGAAGADDDLDALTRRKLRAEIDRFEAEVDRLVAEKEKLEAEASEIRGRSRSRRRAIAQWTGGAAVVLSVVGLWWQTIVEPVTSRAEVTADIGRLEASRQALVNDSISAVLSFLRDDFDEERAQFARRVAAQDARVAQLSNDLRSAAAALSLSEAQGRELRTTLDSIEASGAEPWRVLWVDDQPENNATLSRMLRERGVSVQVATSTEVALRQVEAAPYDLVITDMGRVGDRRAGYTLLEGIKELGLTTPVIVFSTSTDLVRHNLEVQRAGAVGQVSSRSALLDLVETTLGLPPA